MNAALFAIGFLALLLALVALFICDRELQRLDQALAQLAKQAERAEAVAAYALCSVFPKLAEDERRRIPDRFYLAAVQAAALAQDAAKGGLPDTASGGVLVDLTKEAVQLPPSLPG